MPQFILGILLLIVAGYLIAFIVAAVIAVIVIAAVGLFGYHLLRWVHAEFGGEAVFWVVAGLGGLTLLGAIARESPEVIEGLFGLAAVLVAAAIVVFGSWLLARQVALSTEGAIVWTIALTFVAVGAIAGVASAELPEHRRQLQAIFVSCGGTGLLTCLGMWCVPPSLAALAEWRSYRVALQSIVEAAERAKAQALHEHEMRRRRLIEETSAKYDAAEIAAELDRYAESLLAKKLRERLDQLANKQRTEVRHTRQSRRWRWLSVFVSRFFPIWRLSDE